VNPGTRTLHSKNIDKSRDLNELETGFIAGILDGCLSISCCKATNAKGKQHLRWMIRAGVHHAGLATALRAMTGVGEFVEYTQKQRIYWTLGTIDAFFLFNRIPIIQLKKHLIDVFLDYKEESLLRPVKRFDKYIKLMQDARNKKEPALKEMTDANLIGYVIGLLEVSGLAMLLRSGPVIEIYDIPKQLGTLIAKRIGGKADERAVRWEGWKEFEVMYTLTKDKLFTLRNAMETIKSIREGGKLDHQRPQTQKPQKRKKIKIKEVMTTIDQLSDTIRKESLLEDL
jgi:hypothetical protein